MTLEVWTARIGTRDPDALDITRDSVGLARASAFAPSDAIEGLLVRARRAATKIREEAAAREAREQGSATLIRRNADEMEARAWHAFELRYVAEMRVSWGLHEGHKDFGALERAAVANGVRPEPGAWRALLARQRVVLVDFQPEPEFSTRRVLARILARCGAIDRGELPPRGTPAATAPEQTVAPRDPKPANIEQEREELGELVGGFLVLVQEGLVAG